MLNKITYILIFMVLMFIGCGDSASDDRPFTTHPGYEYMPDMYRSPSYETYSENVSNWFKLFLKNWLISH